MIWLRDHTVHTNYLDLCMCVNWDNIVSNNVVIEPDISALLHQRPTTDTI